MSASFTPGPWKIGGIDRITRGETIMADNQRIASCHDFNRYDRDDERKANARLIAASPKLVEACLELLADANQRPGAYLHAHLSKIERAVLEATDAGT